MHPTNQNDQIILNSSMGIHFPDPIITQSVPEDNKGYILPKDIIYQVFASLFNHSNAFSVTQQISLVCRTWDMLVKPHYFEYVGFRSLAMSNLPIVSQLAKESGTILNRHPLKFNFEVIPLKINFDYYNCEPFNDTHLIYYQENKVSFVDLKQTDTQKEFKLSANISAYCMLDNQAYFFLSNGSLVEFIVDDEITISERKLELCAQTRQTFVACKKFLIFYSRKAGFSIWSRYNFTLIRSISTFSNEEPIKDFRVRGDILYWTEPSKHGKKLNCFDLSNMQQYQFDSLISRNAKLKDANNDKITCFELKSQTNDPECSLYTIQTFNVVRSRKKIHVLLDSTIDIELNTNFITIAGVGVSKNQPSNSSIDNSKTESQSKMHFVDLKTGLILNSINVPQISSQFVCFRNSISYLSINNKYVRVTFPTPIINFLPIDSTDNI